MTLLKKISCLVLPIVVFMVLYIPYSFLNSRLIVNWLGCGCNSGFNANDFTRLFWIFASVCTAVISFFTSKKHLSKAWMRGIYAICILLITLYLSIPFCRSMMWK